MKSNITLSKMVDFSINDCSILECPDMESFEYFSGLIVSDETTHTKEIMSENTTTSDSNPTTFKNVKEKSHKKNPNDRIKKSKNYFAQRFSNLVKERKQELQKKKKKNSK